MLVGKPSRKSSLGVDEITILKFITKDVRDEGVDWFQLAQDGIKWWSFVNTMMNLCVSQNWWLETGTTL
jgi:hypothetical protein